MHITMCFYVYIVCFYIYIYVYIYMYIYIKWKDSQTSQHTRECKLHFRTKLLLSNFSSALGISIRQHQTCMLFFFFCFTSFFLSEQTYCETNKQIKIEKSLSSPSSVLWSCSAAMFHNHNRIFLCVQNQCHRLFSHLPWSPSKRWILSWQLISIILLCSCPIVWRWALASPAQNTGKLLFRTSAEATLRGGIWEAFLSR